MPDNSTNYDAELDSAPQLRTKIDWTLWIQWLLATTIGWILGLVLGGELGIGLFVGLAQWLVLRRYVPQAGWWILVSAIGWLIGWAIVVSGVFILPQTGLVSSALVGGILGLVMGVGQWLLLRQWVKLASMWLLLSVSGWAIGLTGVLGSLLVGVVAGAVTGFAFDFLLRFPRNDNNLNL